MKFLLQTIASFTIIILLSGCPDNNEIFYNDGWFPDKPVNFKAVNSFYDDYNAALPVINQDKLLFFSSNRNDAGDNFDIVGDNIFVSWNQHDGTLTVDIKNDERFDFLDTLFNLVNTPFDELGPFSLNYYASGYDDWTNFVVYANNTSGNFQSKMAYVVTNFYNYQYHYDYYGPIEINIIDSDSDDYYISFYGTDFYMIDWQMDINNIEEMYFCSDRNGSHDIFKLAIPGNMDLVEFLTQDTVLTSTKIKILSTEAEDKCPFVNGNLLVFASDRPGGFGGYDLYYSINENGLWSEPENFGNKINTEYDEYRPIAFFINGFKNNLMLFSSNRPGGLGGFDLHYVGIPAMITD